MGIGIVFKVYLASGFPFLATNSEGKKQDRDERKNTKATFNHEKSLVVKGNQGELSMKKTHLYGAVAATMLLAPVTANVLAAEEGEVPSETSLETQNSSELSEQPVLPEQTETEEVNLSAVDEIDNKEENITQKNDQPLSSTVEFKQSEFEIISEESNEVEDSTVSEENENNEGITLVESNSKQGTTLFQYGNGTEEDPYQVSSATELDSIRYDLNAYYVQTAHIDLKGINWTPIGMETETSNTQSFKGVFDGANFAISNLMIREKTEPIYEQFYGLFAKNEGILKNIQLLDVDVAIDAHNIQKLTSPTPRRPAGPIYGGVFASGLTGWDQGTIENCTVSGNIVNQLTKVSDRTYYVGYTGGIAGYSIPKTLIKNCKNYANIRVSYDDKAGTNTTVGGIVGHIGKFANKDHANMVLKDCTNYGDITVENSNHCEIGGLAGFIWGNSENLVNYGNIRLNNSELEDVYSFLAIGSILGQLQHTTFYSETSDYNDGISFPSKTSNVVNFGKIDVVSSSYTSDPHYLIYVNGLIGMIGGLEINGEYSGIENGYNLGDTLNFKWIDSNGNYTNLDLEKYPIYRITNATTSYSYNDPSIKDRNVSIKNCYSVNDFKINEKIVDKFIDSNLENGANVKREELSSLVQTQFPDIKILESGETIEQPTNKEELKKVFEGENYYVFAQSPAGFRDIHAVLEEVESDDNFGYSDQYDTYGYHLYLADKDGNKVQRPGDYYGEFAFPEEFNMRVLHGKIINAATNEVVWEENMGWYRLEGIMIEEENLDIIFVAAELKKKNPKPETPIKTEATFSQDGYQVKAESNEDLTGLEIVIDEVEADNNFGLSSDYQTIGYDIHFENDEGIEVSRTGKFTVRIPIPTEFIGKEVRLFHKENKDAPAKELTFKVIDGKYYEFETTSFSWFIVASQNTSQEPEKPNQPSNPSDTNKPTDNNKPNEKPTDQNKPSNPEKPSENKPMTPVDEVNKPVVKPTVNEGNGTKVIPVKVETLRSVKEESNAEHSPNTGIAVHKTSSMFTGFMSIIGLGFLARKKRKF